MAFSSTYLYRAVSEEHSRETSFFARIQLPHTHYLFKSMFTHSKIQFPIFLSACSGCCLRLRYLLLAATTRQFTGGIINLGKSCISCESATTPLAQPYNLPKFVDLINAKTLDQEKLPCAKLPTVLSQCICSSPGAQSKIEEKKRKEKAK